MSNNVNKTITSLIKSISENWKYLLFILFKSIDKIYVICFFYLNYKIDNPFLCLILYTTSNGIKMRLTVEYCLAIHQRVKRALSFFFLEQKSFFVLPFFFALVCHFHSNEFYVVDKGDLQAYSASSCTEWRKKIHSEKWNW